MSAEPIEILHVFGRMDRGGAELRTLEQMRRLREQGFVCHFLATDGVSGELDGEIEALGGAVHHVRLSPAFPIRMAQLLRRSAFDVVHSHVFYSSGAMLRLARLMGVPVRIAHFRSTSDGRGNGPRRRAQRVLMRRWIESSATHVLAVSRAAMSAAWSAQWEQDVRCRVVYSGLDTASFAARPEREGVRRELGLPGDCPLLVHVGGFRAAKNHSRLVRVFSAALERAPDARLLVVGGGDQPLRREFESVVRRAGIGERVVMAGIRTDVPRLLAAADVMLMPSLWEGLPGVVLEACAAGLPVVASDIAAHREIARHFRSVVLCSLELGDDRWAEAALRAARGERPAQPLAAFSKSPFDMERAVEQLARIYREARDVARGGADR